MALPVSTLKDLPRRVPIARCLQDHPDKTVIDCYKPIIKNRDGELQVIEPLLRAPEFFTSFLIVAEILLNMPNQTVEMIRNHRKKVQHPASHGSAELFSYHFEAFRGKAAGAVFDKERVESYRFAADEIGNVAHLFADILDFVTHHLIDLKRRTG